MILVIVLASLVALSWGLPRDIEVQFERSLLVNGTIVERIFVNDASDSFSKVQFDKQTDGRSIEDVTLRMLVEHDRATADNGTYIRLRECKLRGYQVVRLSDRFQFNGRDYLALDADTDSWKVLVPEAIALKMWAHETEFANLEKTQLKDNCEEIIKQMNDDNHQEELDVLKVIAPVFTTFLFIGCVFTSFLIFKDQHPGGVIGSIIHYPAHHFAGQSQKSNNNSGTEAKQLHQFHQLNSTSA